MPMPTVSCSIGPTRVLGWVRNHRGPCRAAQAAIIEAAEPRTAHAAGSKQLRDTDIASSAAQQPYRPEGCGGDVRTRLRALWGHDEEPARPI